jgi:hypothetical protein
VRVLGVLSRLSKNLLPEMGMRSWLLSDAVNVVPALVLPLAGGEDHKDEDVDMFPNELQYLPSDKQREPLERIRRMLVEVSLCRMPRRQCAEAVAYAGTDADLRDQSGARVYAVKTHLPHHPRVPQLGAIAGHGRAYLRSRAVSHWRRVRP